MAQVPVQGFQIGDIAWLSDGRSGVVRVAAFFAQAGQWGYLLTGLVGTFLESALSRVDPTIVDPGPSVPPTRPPVPSAPSGLSRNDVQRMIDASLAAAITGLLATVRATEDSAVARAEAAVDPRIEALSNSIIRNVAQLSEIQSSLQEQEVTANETGDGGVSGFFRRIGGFIGAPFTALLDVVETWLVREVTDGFNR